MSEKKIGESLGISGFTLSVLSIVLIGSSGIALSILSFIFCYIQQKKNPTRIGKSGLILSIIGFILNIGLILLYIFFLAPKLKSLGAI
jgi:hypothetical protein